MIRDKNPALFYGFAPDYVAATDYIQLDLELGQFHLTNISNDMTQDTKEKAQEVLVPTVIVNIISFVRRFN